MTSRTFTITQSRGGWEGNRGKDKYKTTGHYVMLVILIIGLLAILAVCIWIGTDLSKRASKEQASTQAPTTTASTQAPTTPAPTQAPTTPTAESVVLGRLRQEVGSDDQVFLTNFTNWDKTTVVGNLYKVIPNEIGDIPKLVVAAKELGLTIRAVGSGLSYSNLFTDEGQIQLDASKLTTKSDGEPFTYDQDTSTLSAAAGQTVGALVDFLVENDIQVMSLPVARETTLGGAISTASHGNSADQGTLSSQVVSAKYVDGNGDLRVADADTEEDLRRIRCCVGLCGIIYEISFKTEPIQMIRVVQGFESGYTIIKNETYLRGLLELHEGLEMHYAPLSSLTDDEWNAYLATGELPASSYDPWKDEWWYRILEKAPITKRRKRQAAGELEVSPLETGVVQNATTNTSTPISTELILHRYAYTYTLGLVEATPQTILPYPEAASHINAADLDITYGVLLVIPDTPELNILQRAMQVAFDVLKEYIILQKMPIISAMVRWLSTSQDCILCSTSLPDGNATHILTVELIGSAVKPNYFEFASKLLNAYKSEWPEVQLGWAKFYESMTDVEDFIHESKLAALRRMNETVDGSTVQLWDVFMSDLLSEVVYNP